MVDWRYILTNLYLPSPPSLRVPLLVESPEYFGFEFGGLEGEVPEGEVEVPVGEVPEGEAPEGEFPEGEVPEGEAPEGEASEGEAPEGDPPEGEAPEGGGSEYGDSDLDAQWPGASHREVADLSPEYLPHVLKVLEALGLGLVGRVKEK